MSNVHVQTAATNLRQAINDARVRQQQLRDEINRIQHDADEQIKQKDVQRALLKMQGNDNTNDAGKRIQVGVSYDRLEVEEKQVRQNAESKRRELENEIKTFDDQIARLDSVAHQLDAMI